MIFSHILGRSLPSKSSKKSLLKSTMPKMPKMLKRLRRPTFFRVHAPRVQPRRAILPPQAWLKRVGGGGPPRGVSIKLPDVESKVEIKLKRRLKNVGNFSATSTRGLLAIVRGP